MGHVGRYPWLWGSGARSTNSRLGSEQDIGSLISTGLVLGIEPIHSCDTHSALWRGLLRYGPQRRGHLQRAIFNWPLVIVASIVAFVSLLTS